MMFRPMSVRNLPCDGVDAKKQCLERAMVEVSRLDGAYSWYCYGCARLLLWEELSNINKFAALERERAATAKEPT